MWKASVSCVDHGMEMGGLDSRRQSEIGEQLTLEPTSDAPPQRRRKKKKTATIGKENLQMLQFHHDENDEI